MTDTEPKKIAETVREKCAPLLRELHARSNALELSLWVLRSTKDLALADRLSAKQVHDILGELEVGCGLNAIKVALSRARDREIIASAGSAGVAYGISKRGRALLDRTDPVHGIEVWHVEPGKKWTAWRNLEDFSPMLSGPLQISDPYYGQRSLHALQILANRPDGVRLLSCLPASRRGTTGSTVRVAAGDFVSQTPNVEIRLVAPPAPFHDRYIVSDHSLTILGQGLEGLGEKESFVIHLPEELVADTLQTLRQDFETRWQAATRV